MPSTTYNVTVNGANVTQNVRQGDFITVTAVSDEPPSFGLYVNCALFNSTSQYIKTITFGSSTVAAYSFRVITTDGTFFVSGNVAEGPDLTVDYTVSDNISSTNVTYEGVVGGLDQYVIPADYNSGASVVLSSGSGATSYRLYQVTAAEDTAAGNIVAAINYTNNQTLGITGIAGAGLSSELPNNGQTTWYRIEARLNGTTDPWDPCYTADNSASAEFRIRRADFVAPVLQNANNFLVGNIGANVDIEVKTSSVGSGGYLRYAQNTSSTPPSTASFAWQTSNLFTQDRDTTRWYFAARLYNHPDEGTNVEAYDVASFFAGYLAPVIDINAISDKLIGPGDASVTITISGGSDTTVYQVRTTSAAGTVVGSVTGDGDIIVSSGLPTFGAETTYYLTAYRLDSAGGDVSEIYTLASPNNVVVVERSYYTPDPCNAIANFDVDQDNATFSISVTGTDSRTTHELRTGGYTGTVVDTCTGNNQTLTDDADWTIGTGRTYYITAYVSTANGGTQTRTNVDSFTVTRAYDVPSTPTDITFSVPTSSFANIVVTTTVTPPSGNYTSLQIRKDGNVTWKTTDASNQATFTGTRGTQATYDARAVNGTAVSSARTETYTPPYLATNSTITAIPDQNMTFAQSSFSVSITGGQLSTQIYQIRTGSATGTVVASSTINNGTITVSGASNLPAAGGFKDYYVTTYRTTASGGNASNIVNTGDVFRVTKTAGSTTPNAFDPGLGGDAEGVILDSGLYESQQSTITGIEVPVTATYTSPTGTGGGFRVNGAGSYTSSSKTVNPNDTIQIGITAASTQNTTRTGKVTINGVEGDFSVITETISTGGSTEGDGGTGTYGLRCYNSSNQITLDITDRVSTAVATISNSLAIGQTSKAISLPRSGSTAIWLNPPSEFTVEINGDIFPNTDKLLEFNVSGSTLNVSRDTSSTAVSFTVLVVND